jgi:hypothetical protein
MREIHVQVTSQSEFTAQRVADAAGISKVWLYHIAGEEFRALRAELPGSRKTRDEEVAMVMLEQCEQENLELRGHIRVLTRRLEQAGGYVDIPPPSSQADRKSHLKPVDS